MSTCLYIDRGVLETARAVGLNLSKVSENALIEAIGKLAGAEPRTGLRSPSPRHVEGRGRDLNPGARLHRPIGYQATSPRPLSWTFA
jgi:post-segregation antitoxin (ccd killing protein)